MRILQLFKKGLIVACVLYSPVAAAQSTPSAEQGEQSATVDSATPEHLYGTWKALNADVPQTGDADIKLVFKKSGQVHFLAWSDILLVGQVRNKTAPYHIEESRLVSDAIPGDTSLKYHFTDSGKLVLQYNDGNSITFHKVDDR